MNCRREHAFAVASAILLAWTSVGQPAAAQEAVMDTTRVYELGMITTTAERGPAVVARTTSATTAESAASMRTLPHRTAADWLALTPGLGFVSLDGLGYDPQPIVRGFYGGGEAEYVLLLVNGVPIGNSESGLVNWNLLPVRAVEHVEILRGGSSALFGDAALGAVVNLVTDASRPEGVFSVASGTDVPLDSELSYAGRLRNSPFHVFGKYNRIDGFRDHAGREAGSFGASIDLLPEERTDLGITTLHFVSDSDIPGPLLRETAAREPRESTAFYRFDRRKESTHLLTVSGSHDVSSASRLHFSTTGKIRLDDITESVPLSADFADTQQRELTDLQGIASLRLNTRPARFPGGATAGVDIAGSRISSDYYRLLSGTLADYLDPANPQPSAAASGHGTRTQAAGFVHLFVDATSRLRVTAGGRLDAIRDSFSPDDADPTTTTHTAFSPKIGLNFRFVSRSTLVGNIYANASRSFKAPTLDQLFDQRTIPVPFPPFQISLSSSSLKPQTGKSLEVGIYQQIQPAGSDISAEITLSAYQIDMQDEIDFDLQELSYRNLGESRHRGIESRMSLYYRDLVTVRLGYTYQGTTLEYGDFRGNFVKAIPRDMLTGSLSLTPGAFSAGLTVHSMGRIYLDDANTVRLPDYTNVSARMVYDFARFSVAADVMNLLDRRFSTTGFPDPGGSDAVFLYPFAGRHGRLSVTVRLP